MLLGYARVSTDQQDHALQLDALRAAGCERVFVETGSGTRTDRAELAKLLEQARPDDEIVVWRLDRLGRSLRHLIDLSEQLQQRGVALRSLTKAIDTSTPAGRFLLSILGALASMEREIVAKRTQAGLLAAATLGPRDCRPPSMDQARIRVAKAMLASGTLTAGKVPRQLRVAASTLYRHLSGSRGTLSAATTIVDDRARMREMAGAG